MSNKQTQLERLGKLLTRKRGITSWEIMQEVGTVCPHKRMSDLKERGWLITKTEVLQKNFFRYFGVPPKAKTATCSNK